MKISFTTLGCKLNFAESSSLGQALLSRGHERAKQGEQADVCIVNTCSVTDNADHKDRQMIHRLRRQHPDATLIVTGCYAQLKPQEVANIPGVDYVLGQDEKFDIPALVERLETLRGEHTDNADNAPADIQAAPYYDTQRDGDHMVHHPCREVPFHGAFSRDDRTRCFLKVQDGCNYFCTYCTIPLARGKSRNPSIESLTKEAKQALLGGAKEIVLTGVNIGDFGRSTGEQFIDLLRALDTLDVATPYRIRISSCEPNLLSDEVIDFVAHSSHFAPHFHIPLQSGSNTVLQIMHRRYTRELFAERVEHIKRVMPHAFIGVDCMVGVRGETEECWREYVQFISALPVSQLHVFTYSERANTRMLELNICVVPQKERERRSRELHAVSQQLTDAFYLSQRGRTATVLWESKRIRREGYPDLMEGFTENYVKLSCPYDKQKINTFEQIVI